MASGTVDPIDWTYPLSSLSVPPEHLVHSINQCSLSRESTMQPSALRGHHLAFTTHMQGNQLLVAAQRTYAGCCTRLHTAMHTSQPHSTHAGYKASGCHARLAASQRVYAGRVRYKASVCHARLAASQRTGRVPRTLINSGPTPVVFHVAVSMQCFNTSTASRPQYLSQNHTSNIQISKFHYL